MKASYLFYSIGTVLVQPFFGRFHQLRWFVGAILIAGLPFFVGCQPSSPAKSTNKTTKQDDHDHDHDHGHSHEEAGKHGGHLVDLEPAGQHAEWTHDDDAGLVHVYLEEMVSGGAKIEKVRVDITLDKQPTKSYELQPAAADEHKIDGSIFTLKSPELVTALGMSEGVKAELIVTVDGKDHKASLEHDHDHDHDHGSGHGNDHDH